MRKTICLWMILIALLITFTIPIYAEGEIQTTVAEGDIEAVVDTDKDLDTDGDGLSDFQEKYKYFTDPNKADSDGDGISDSDWLERREYTYTVTTTLKITHPYNIDSMNNDYQDTKIINEKENYIECEVVLYPENKVKASIKGNEAWGNYGEEFNKYLKPYIYTNWDEQMRTDLINELKNEGINPDELSDKDLVQKVSIWIRDKFKNVQHILPAEFFIRNDEKGNIYVDEKYRNVFEEKVKADKSMTDEKIFNSLVLGKQMYYNRTRGGCTSSAIHSATIYRALGIPTRHILTTKIRTTNKYMNFVNNLKNPVIKEIFLKNAERRGNHFFNEVYIGDRWVRIDYDEFGFGSIHIDRGVYFQHYTMNDMSEIDLAGIFGGMTSSRGWGPFGNEELIEIINLTDDYGPYYVESYSYDIDPSMVDKYFIFGDREFGPYVRSNIIAEISKAKTLERGKSGSINYLIEEYFGGKNLIIISANNVYDRLPEKVKKGITLQEYSNLTRDEYRVFKVNEATILIIKD